MSHRVSQMFSVFVLDLFRAMGLFVRVISDGKAGMSSNFESGWPTNARENSLLVGPLAQVKCRPPGSNTV